MTFSSLAGRVGLVDNLGDVLETPNESSTTV